MKTSCRKRTYIIHSPEESKVSDAAWEAFKGSGQPDLQGVRLRSSKRPKGTLARQNRMSIEHEVREEAKGNSDLRRKVEKFVEMLRSEEISAEVNPATVTPPKEANSDAKAAR